MTNTPTHTVALTGATGFVGSYVLTHLLQAGYAVRALSRSASKLPKHPRLTIVQGELSAPAALARLVENAQSVIHLVGIIAEVPRKGQTFERVHVQGTADLLAAALPAGVSRWVQMSALGARADAPARYFTTKWQAEEAVRASGLPATIFRPSIIHGPEGEFIQMVKGFWTSWLPPFVPYFGAGPLGLGKRTRVQPIWVDDVARCFVGSLSAAATINKTYCLGGPDILTWPELYAAVKRHLPAAKPKPILAIPAWKARLIAGLPLVPFNRDQVEMSQEDSLCDMTAAQADLGIQMAPFEPTLAQYASRI